MQDLLQWAVGVIVTAVLFKLGRSETISAKLRIAKTEDRLDAAEQRDAERLQRERDQAARAVEANQIRRWLFAHEAVELCRRWLIHARMILDNDQTPHLSQSQTFEWVEFRAVEEFLRTGGAQEVVQALYTVKEVNRQVQLQIERAQEGGSDQKAAFYRLEQALSGESPISDIGDAGVAQKLFHDNVGYIVAFLFAPDQWPRVRLAIDVLIRAVEADQRFDAASLRSQFVKDIGKGDELAQAWWSQKGIESPVLESLPRL